MVFVLIKFRSDGRFRAVTLHFIYYTAIRCSRTGATATGHDFLRYTPSDVNNITAVDGTSETQGTQVIQLRL